MTEQKHNQSRAASLDGSELTHELFSDVYMAGTSDGVQQLADGSIVVEPVGYDAGASEKSAAKRKKKP